MVRFKLLELTTKGAFVYVDNERQITCEANIAKFLIQQAWAAGINFEDLADGFGAGQGTNGDWSGIRDSSKEAVAAMFERAINALAFKKP